MFRPDFRGIRVWNRMKLEWIVYFDIKRIRRDNEKREKRARLVEKERRKYGSAKMRWFLKISILIQTENYTAFYVTQSLFDILLFSGHKRSSYFHYRGENAMWYKIHGRVLLRIFVTDARYTIWNNFLQKQLNSKK